MGKQGRFVKTKIVATIGPASTDQSTLLKMIRNGMSLARLNFSHGSHDHHLEVINRIRKLSAGEDMPVVLLQDLSGPKIRLGALREPVRLKRNQVIKLSVEPVEKDPDAHLYTDFKQLPEVVKKGETLLIDDGYIELKAVEVRQTHVLCKVKVPGIATSRKGINLPESTISVPVFTGKDEKDLGFGLSRGVDMVAMSFVESAANIVPIKEMMEKYSRQVPVIAKIERPVALKHIDGIMDAFDGIMIARGDLGVEVPLEEVPIIQKRLINMANVKNKLVITATQMLESMINNPRPTRAEASDVSNAILDGSDAVMLSGETAVGRYPVKAVNMMRRIIRTTEGSRLYQCPMDLCKETFDHTEAIVRSAARIASDLKAKFIIVFSFSGDTALKLSKYRPHCPVFAFSPQNDAVTRMASYWGVFPHLIPFTRNTDEMIHYGEEVLKTKQLAKQGDLAITVSGRAPMKGATNMLKISHFGKQQIST